MSDNLISREMAADIANSNALATHQLCVDHCLALLREIQKNGDLEKSAVRVAAESLIEKSAGVEEMTNLSTFVDDVKRRLNEELD